MLMGTYERAESAFCILFNFLKSTLLRFTQELFRVCVFWVSLQFYNHLTLCQEQFKM